MLKDQKPYTVPSISKGQQCFIFFRHCNEATNKWDLFVKKGGANKKGLKASERNDLLKSLRDALEYKLTVRGWPPTNDTYPQVTPDNPHNVL